MAMLAAQAARAGIRVLPAEAPAGGCWSRLGDSAPAAWAGRVGQSLLPNSLARRAAGKGQPASPVL
jgi:hypothetical protein